MHNPTLLIVDDTPLNIQILAESLCSEYQIKISTNGAEALQIYELSHVDLVLLDVQMPEMDGYEVCRRMKSIAGKEGVPIIFVTTNSTPEDKAAGIEAGAVDYITKPVNLPMLRDRLKTHLANIKEIQK
ncbi:MAG TPA: response regulator [Methylobacter sp.]|jgi:putative two-component system response regulator